MMMGFLIAFNAIIVACPATHHLCAQGATSLTRELLSVDHIVTATWDISTILYRKCA